MIAQRRRRLIRDWILVVIALSLAMAAGLFRPDHGRGRAAAAAAFVR